MSNEKEKAGKDYKEVAKNFIEAFHTLVVLTGGAGLLFYCNFILWLGAESTHEQSKGLWWALPLVALAVIDGFTLVQLYKRAQQRFKKD